MRKQLMAIVVVAALAVGGGTLARADDPQPSAADAAKAAQEELRWLPAGVEQVDCAPGMPTFPPYTRLSGAPGSRRHILSDGRCFLEPAGPGNTMPSPVPLNP